MPVQAVTPWDALADAYERLRDAEREGGDVAGARAAVDLHKDACAALGSLLLVYALERGGLAVQRVLHEAFAGTERLALEKATRAGKGVKALLARADWLEVRVRELERAVADLTPGVGPPGLRTVG